MTPCERTRISGDSVSSRRKEITEDIKLSGRILTSGLDKNMAKVLSKMAKKSPGLQLCFECKSNRRSH